MSNKNKFWNKDKQVTPITDEADLENTTTESLNTKVELSKELDKIIEETKLNEVIFVTEKLPSAFEMGQYHGIELVLDVLYNHPKNMFDTAYNIDTIRVADWIKEKLKNKGFDL